MHAQYTLLMTLVALSSLVLVLMLIAVPVRYMRDYHRRVISIGGRLRTMKLTTIAMCILAVALYACSRYPGQPPTQPPTQPAAEPVPRPAQLSAQPAPLTAADFQARGISIDMRIEDAKKALGTPTTATYIQGVGADALIYQPLGLHVFFDRVTGLVTGWSIVSTATLTARGIGVGATKEAVLAAYGTKMDATSGDIRIFYRSPDDKELLIGFELLYGKVLRISAGGKPLLW